MRAGRVSLGRKEFSVGDGGCSGPLSPSVCRVRGQPGTRAWALPGGEPGRAQRQRCRMPVSCLMPAGELRRVPLRVKQAGGGQGCQPGG